MAALRLCRCPREGVSVDMASLAYKYAVVEAVLNVNGQSKRQITAAMDKARCFAGGGWMVSDGQQAVAGRSREFAMCSSMWILCCLFVWNR
jgi:hypothetical protein